MTSTPSLFFYPSHLLGSLEPGNLLLDSLLALVVRLARYLVLLGLGLVLLLGLLAALAFNLLERVGTDGAVCLGVDILQTVGLEIVVNVLVELLLVPVLVVVGKLLHVLGNVATENVLLERLAVKFLGLNVVAGETLLRVRHKDTTVRSTLQDGKHAGTGRGAGKTDVKEGLEWTARLAIVTLGGLGERKLTVSLLNTRKLLVEAELLEHTASNEKTDTVRGGPVGKAVLDAVRLELVRVGGNKHLVTVDFGRNNLGDDIAVREPDDEAVLGRAVLVLGLRNETLAGVVVGLAFTSSAVLGLVPAANMLGKISRGAG